MYHQEQQDRQSGNLLPDHINQSSQIHCDPLVSTLALVCGIVACALNAIFVGLPLGFILGLISLICGIISSKRYRKSGGLLFALLSFLVLFLWAITIAVPFLADPTLHR